MMFGYSEAEERFLTHTAKVNQIDRNARNADPIAAPVGSNHHRSSAAIAWVGRLRYLRHPWLRLPRAESRAQSL